MTLGTGHPIDSPNFDKKSGKSTCRFKSEGGSPEGEKASEPSGWKYQSYDTLLFKKDLV